MTKLAISILILAVSFLNSSCESNQKMEALKVIGIIKDKTLVEVPNKAAGKPGKKESRITLDVLEVNGSKTSELNHPVFTGTEEMLQPYTTGQKVEIVCTSSTGRQIQKISAK